MSQSGQSSEEGLSWLLSSLLTTLLIVTGVLLLDATIGKEMRRPWPDTSASPNIVRTEKLYSVPAEVFRQQLEVQIAAQEEVLLETKKAWAAYDAAVRETEPDFYQYYKKEILAEWERLPWYQRWRTRRPEYRYLQTLKAVKLQIQVYEAANPLNTLRGMMDWGFSNRDKWYQRRCITFYDWEKGPNKPPNTLYGVQERLDQLTFLLRKTEGEGVIEITELEAERLGLDITDLSWHWRYQAP